VRSVRKLLYSTLYAVVIYMLTCYTTSCGLVERLLQAGVCRVSESLTFLDACSRDVCSHTLHTCVRTCATSACKERVSVGCQQVLCFLLHALVMFRNVCTHTLHTCVRTWARQTAEDTRQICQKRPTYLKRDLQNRPNETKKRGKSRIIQSYRRVRHVRGLHVTCPLTDEL